MNETINSSETVHHDTAEGVRSELVAQPELAMVGAYEAADAQLARGEIDVWQHKALTAGRAVPADRLEAHTATPASIKDIPINTDLLSGGDKLGKV